MYFGFALNIRFWQFIYEKVNITDIDSAWFLLSLFFFILVPLFWFFCVITIPKVAKPLIIFFLIISSISQYMMLHYRIYIDKNMIQNILETNVHETLDLITESLFFLLSITGLLPAVLLCYVLLK